MSINTGTAVGYSYRNITTNTTTRVKSGAGILHTLVINKPVATGTIAIYDGVDANGTLIGTVTTPTDAETVSLLLDAHVLVGIAVVTAVAAQDITVTFI